MLEQRMREVAEEYGFPFRTAEDGESWLVECVFEGGRSQVVSGTTLATDGGRRPVLYTFVGPWTPEVDLEDLVRRHLTWGRSRVGILDEDLVVCCPLDPGRVEGEDGRAVVEEALQRVSIRGDELEEELFGTDEN